MLNKSKKNVHGVVNLNNARPSLNKNQRPSVKKIQTIDPNIENIRAARENNQVNTSKNKKIKQTDQQLTKNKQMF